MRRRADIFVWAAYAAIALSCFLVLTFGYGRDQGIYAVVARRVVEGGMPYRDAWDFKPPGIFLIYAAARGALGGAPWAIRVVEVLGMLGSCALMVALARRWWGDGRLGLLAAALATLVHAQLDFWHSAQPESFGGMLTMLGLYVGSDPRPSRHARAQLAAGLIFGFAGLLKPPLAGGGAMLAFWWAWQGRRDGRWAGPLLRVLAGGVVGPLLCLAWFWWRGALPDLHEVLFRFTPHYTALGWHGRHLGSLLLEAVEHWLLDYSAPIVIGMALLVPWWRRIERRRAMGLLAAMIAIQLLGVALQGKFFPYHYGGLWPLCALLAARGWWALGSWARQRHRAGALITALALLGSLPLRTATKDVEGHFWWRSAYRLRVYLLQLGDQSDRDRLASVGDVDAAANRRLAQQLASRTTRDEPIYIWGFQPSIYDAADRRSASRYIYNVPQRAPWWQQGARRDLMTDLAATPPRIIVVASGDPLPMVTGDGVDSAGALEDFTALRELLDQRYGRLMQIEDFALYVKR